MSTCDRQDLRQLVYVSCRTPGYDAELEVPFLLARARHNNTLDGITGLIRFDGQRFVQVLEGSGDGVQETFDRISADPRHDRIEVLSDRVIDAREFGSWSMACQGNGCNGNEYDELLARRLRDADPILREAFLGEHGTC